MSPLAIVSTVVGVLIIAARLPGVIAPVKYREFAINFPRSVWWGRVLMAVAAVWTGVYLFQWAREEVPRAMPYVVVGIPVSYVLVIKFADQFLSVRAAAALGLLVARWMVGAADTSDLPLRLIVTVLAYVWVVAAMWMTIAPHQLRDVIGYLMANDGRCRTACSVNVALGALLVVLGLFVY